MWNMEWPEWAIEIIGAMMISIAVSVAYAMALFVFKKVRRLIRKGTNVLLSLLAWILLLLEKMEDTMEALNNPISSRLFVFLMCAAAITCVNVWATEIGDSDLSKEA